MPGPDTPLPGDGQPAAAGGEPAASTPPPTVAGSGDSDQGPETGPDVAVPTVESLIADLERVTEERDLLQRVAAEYANFRTSTDKRQADMASQASARVVDRILPVLDACDSAVLQGADDVLPVQSALLDVLRREGLEPIDAVDVAFDPHQHDAVLREEVEGDEQTVIEVLRTGYRLNGKVLRAAMVKVRG